MSTPALAPVPVLIASTGIRANTGLAQYQDHRNHAVRENPDGKQEDPEGGRFTARYGPVASPFPLLPDLGRRGSPSRGRT
jgi:hypothetical protein